MSVVISGAEEWLRVQLLTLNQSVYSLLSEWISINSSLMYSRVLLLASVQQCRLLQKKKKIAKQVQTQTSFVPNEFPLSHNNTVVPVSGKKIYTIRFTFISKTCYYLKVGLGLGLSCLNNIR